MKALTIKHSDIILSLGSCFSTEIGSKIKEEGFNININPFGVLFNPASIAISLQRLSSGDPFTHDDIIYRDPNYGAKKHIHSDERSFQTNGTNNHRPIAPSTLGYTSFFHHGSFTRSTPEEFLADANKSLKEASRQYHESRYIIVTFGTAWIYRHLEKNIIVSNCHKHIAAEFRREFLTIDQIAELYRPIIKTAGSNINWIFTVSPIRHLKDGLHGNQISKSTLLLAENQLCTEFDNVHYFPAYEIVLDELRDYKYFASDTIHPTPETIDYVWDKFRSEYL